ncbi:hypothetical protein M569_06425 [Genlisea aurea]|uniref:Germin-like protein n=1 Tax=Genlisea aurea TaxID=192259 RepID=S8CMI3_9LAMI|nr:hypothetical protein M569_06425 [Genlisea aurea]
MASSSSSSALRCSITISLLLLAFTYASDPTQLQDFCVAVSEAANPVFVNGEFCKNPATVAADDFVFHGLNVPGNTSNEEGSTVTHIFASQIPGLNTLGVGTARIDFAPYGLNPPHVHPRASEALLVLEGNLYAGFLVASDPENKLFARILSPGDVFVFPQGLVHFQLNVGNDTTAVALAFLGSQNPGVVTVADSVFGSRPSMDPDALAKAFRVDKSVINYLQKHH